MAGFKGIEEERDTNRATRRMRYNDDKKKVSATRNVLITKARLAQGHLHTLKKELRKDTRIFFFS